MSESDPGFFDIFDNFPDWKDGGRCVEVRTEEGRIVSGRLRAEVEFNGEDEYPVWSVVCADKSTHSLVDFKTMRYVS